VQHFEIAAKLQHNRNSNNQYSPKQPENKVPKQPILTKNAPAPSGGYNQAIRAGQFLYLSGQGPSTPDGVLIDSDFEMKVRQVFENLSQVATAAGFSLSDAIKINVYLDSMDDFDTMDRIYREVVPMPYPTRTTISCDVGGIGIEVDAVLWSDIVK
jgi:2-iminobutanoate/2-iminopropanoate deaminase